MGRFCNCGSHERCKDIYHVVRYIRSKPKETSGGGYRDNGLQFVFSKLAIVQRFQLFLQDDEIVKVVCQDKGCRGD